MAVEPDAERPDQTGAEKDPPEVDAEIVDAEFAGAPETLTAEGDAPKTETEGRKAFLKHLPKLSPGLMLFIGFVAVAIATFAIFAFWRAGSDSELPQSEEAPLAEENLPAEEAPGEAPGRPAADAGKISNELAEEAREAAANVDSSAMPPSTRELPPAPPPGSANEELQRAAKQAIRQEPPDDGDAIGEGPPRAPEIEFRTGPSAPTLAPGASGAVDPPAQQDLAAASAASNAEIAALKENFDRELSQRDARANAEIASLRAELDQLRSAQTFTPQGRDPAAFVALAALQRAVDRGVPYAEELDAFARLEPGAPPVDRLRTGAATGAPTLASLRDSFDAAARAAIAAEAREKASGWLGGVAARVQQMVSVRPAEPTAGSGAPQVISRAEGSLESGDLAGAAAEIGALKGAAATEFAPWLEKARLRLAADESVAALNAAFLTAYQN